MKRADPKEILRTLDLLFRPGDVVEMRVPKAGRDGTISGYFNDFEELAKCLAARNGENTVYVTMNPVNPALLARCSNRIRVRADITTSDHDILCRRWLLVDCDPVRPAGISSSNEEHDAARQKAEDIRAVLREEGWPEPILADSGNGWHLLYRIDLPNDDRATKIVEAILKDLASRFDDDRVKIDQTVFNASRIVKAYGTWSRKGDDMPERPHRVSHALQPADAVEPQTDLSAYEPQPVAAPMPSHAADRSYASFDMEGFIARHTLNVRAPVQDRGKLKWLFEECPFNPDHKAPDAALLLYPSGVPGFKCFHNSCHGKDWKALRELFEPRSARSEETSETIIQTPKKQVAPAHVIESRAPESIWWSALHDLEIPAEESLFQGYPIPAFGATLRNGTAKSGKTVLAVQEAIAVATGEPMFGRYPVLKPGPVMILEQDDPKAKRSIKDLLGASGVPKDAPILLIPKVSFSLGSEAMLDWLANEIAKHAFRMVVLDSYTALRGSRPPGIDIAKFEQMELTRMDELAGRLCAMTIVHHASKGAAGMDWTQAAAGSFAMTAATEMQAHMSRYAEYDSGTERLLRLRGRHCADLRLALDYDPPTQSFRLIMSGDAAEHLPLVRQINNQFGEEIFGPKEFMHATGYSHSQTHRVLLRLLDARVLYRSGVGKYALSQDLRV